MTPTVKVGDRVLYRPGFGGDSPVTVRIESMELTEWPRSKHGESINEVTLRQISENLVLFSFDNGHWGYSDQFENVVL